MLYIATLAFAKMSIISLLMILTASQTHRHMGFGLTGFIAVWGMLSELVAAFQCGTHEPWRFLEAGEKCVDMVCTPPCDIERRDGPLLSLAYRFLSGRPWR